MKHEHCTGEVVTQLFYSDWVLALSLGKGGLATCLISLETDNLSALTGQRPSACRCVIMPIREEKRHQRVSDTPDCIWKFLRGADTLILLTKINQVRPGGNWGIIHFRVEIGSGQKAPFSFVHQEIYWLLHAPK